MNTCITCIHACMHVTCIHAYMHTCIHAYMHTCIRVPTFTSLIFQQWCLHFEALIRGFLCQIFMYLYVCMYVSMYAYTQICTHTHMHATMHTTTQTYAHITFFRASSCSSTCLISSSFFFTCKTNHRLEYLGASSSLNCLLLDGWSFLLTDHICMYVCMYVCVCERETRVPAHILIP